MPNDPPYIPFSQRAGLSPVPPQLKLGEASSELRRLFAYYIGLEIDRETHSGFEYQSFDSNWKRVATDFHVLLLGKDAHTYNYTPHQFKEYINLATRRMNIAQLFDLIEFFARHPRCSAELKRELSDSFVKARAAYRIIDSQIVAIGTEEQAAAFEKAVADAGERDAGGARQHLILAGVALRNSDWAGSVRESIHAVEAMALRLAPDTTTLGPALAALERRGHLHGSLKAAFGSLYGYSSDEEGIRHARVFKEEAEVDEADALFMLGACASFVSYLLARGH